MGIMESKMETTICNSKHYILITTRGPQSSAGLGHGSLKNLGFGVYLI